MALVFHSGAGLLVLLLPIVLPIVLSVFKPKGLTGFGFRKRQTPS